MQPAKSTAVGTLALLRPDSIRYLEQLGVDYYCRGDETVEEAALCAGVDPDILLASLEKSPATAWSTSCPLEELVRFLRERHREILDGCFPRLLSRLQEAAARDPFRSDLAALHDRAAQLCENVRHHVSCEEALLFPLSGGQRGTAAAVAGANARSSVEWMFVEHAGLAEQLRDLGHAVRSAEAPADASALRAQLLRDLAMLERRLHESMHLENNALFPRILAGGASGRRSRSGRK